MRAVPQNTATGFFFLSFFLSSLFFCHLSAGLFLVFFLFFFVIEIKRAPLCPDGVASVGWHWVFLLFVCTAGWMRETPLKKIVPLEYVRLPWNLTCFYRIPSDLLTCCPFFFRHWDGCDFLDAGARISRFMVSWIGMIFTAHFYEFPLIFLYFYLISIIRINNWGIAAEKSLHIRS